MNTDKILEKIAKLGPGPVKVVEKYLNKIPSIRKEIESQTNEIMGEMEDSMRPYKDEYVIHDALPSEGVSHEDLLKTMQELESKEHKKWEDGYTSGTVYHGNPEHVNFLNEVYALHSQTNPLHSDLFPSITKYEAEVISMTANMLGAQNTSDEVCGAISSGGTESICLAMKTYRDWGIKSKGIEAPEMVIPVTAHAAFYKAAEYYQIKLHTVPVHGPDYKVKLSDIKKKVNRNTVVIVGSAPTFPHGVIDPIAEISEFAKKRGIGMHVDCCLGGFILPWAKKLGYNVPEFDFSLPGVTSISADTHKYGYAAKGTSVVLYRNEDLRRHQYFTITEWPGGIYFSPTFAGSRAGALSAVCWANLVSIGEKGFIDATEKILKTADFIKAELNRISEVQIIGDPLWNISFKSDQFNIYQIMDYMTKKGWTLNGLHKPSCIHICLTLRHAEEGVKERFIADLKSSIEEVKLKPEVEGGSAPVYGMAATMPLRGTVSNLLKKYMDALYKVK
jgi:glutamate/tyrosine decarboxylase-like PLP-dependent enzyme